MEDLTKLSYLGCRIAYIHLIGFQKQSLTHAHIILILVDDNKHNRIKNYDWNICAELLEPVQEAILHTSLASTMRHGTCESAKCPMHGGWQMLQRLLKGIL